MDEISHYKDDISSLVSSPDINTEGAMASLAGIDWGNKITTILSDWVPVDCPNGKGKVFILKNPNKAFELYSKEWSTKFKIVVDALNQAKVEAEGDIKVKIDKLFSNLDYVEATLRQAYQNAYLTFAGNPCSDKSHSSKFRIDEIILAAALGLTTVKLLVDMKGAKAVDEIYMELISMNREIIRKIMR